MYLHYVKYFIQPLQLRSCVSAPILSAVQTSFHSRRSIKMDDETANSARKYYEMIVNADSPYSRKKSLIYDDLVIGTKTELSMPYTLSSVSLHFGIFPYNDF